jgi:hypothetical protein
MSELHRDILATYEAMLSSARKEHSCVPIGNRYPWQCRAAVEALATCASELQAARVAARTSQSTKLPVAKTGTTAKTTDSTAKPVFVRILTASFPSYVFAHGGARKTFEAFLHAGGRVRIMCWARTIDYSQNSLSTLRLEFPDQFELRISGTDKYADELSHFLVVEDFAYRLEQPHPPAKASDFRDFSPEVPAKICFNDKDTGERLVTFFDDLWTVAKP